MASSSGNCDVSKPSNAASNSSVQEYIVKMPKNKSRKFNVMRFSNSHKIDVTKWTQAQIKMERENNLREFKADEDMPKYGAGSEFGREQREESRRKKYGIQTKKYNPEDQPWILKMGGKGGRKYKGIREGGVTENTSYYVFTQAADGTFEAYPVEEWYNFTPIQRYKALSAEEAEEEFGRRDKVLNYFSIMVRKRLQKESNEEEEEDGEKQSSKKGKKKQPKDFKISDMDDWAKDSSDSDDEERDEEDSSGPKKSSSKKDKKNTQKKKENVENEGREESDEGDFDDREVDYMTDSSGSEPELEEEKTNNALKGVEDEEALRKLFNSDDEEEEEGEDNKNKEAEENQQEDKEKEKAAADQSGSKQGDPEAKGQKKGKKNKEAKGGGGDSSGDSTSETSDSDFDDTKIHAVFMQKQAKKNGSDNSASSSRANTPTRLNQDSKEGHKLSKRKLSDTPMSASKKVKLDGHGGSTTFVNSLDGITEETIRRYLSRKPMTASELLHKFKSKKTRLTSDQLVTRIADVLKKMDLLKRNIKGKMYLSLKT